jgi:hypothetical protein
MKNGQKLNLGNAHATPNKYPRGTSVKAWGYPRGTPFFIGKNQVTFLLLHALCVFLGASLLLLSVFFCFVCCNKWLDHIMFLLEEMNSLFICQEHSSFHTYRSMSVLFLCYLI